MEISEKHWKCRFTTNKGFKVAISSCDGNVKKGNELTVGFNFSSKIDIRIMVIELRKEKRNMVRTTQQKEGMYILTI